MLRAVETAGLRGLKDDELAAWVRRHEQKHLPLHGNNVAARFPLLEERRRDEAAHFILRLAFCGAVPREGAAPAQGALLTPEDGRRWLVQQEVQLLRLRLQLLARESRAERDHFLAHALAHVRSTAPDAVGALPAAEKAALLAELRAVHGAEGAEDEFLRVRWELVPDLVGRRAVLLRQGVALVPRAEAASVILSCFREELEAALERIARDVPFLRDDRIVPLLDALRQGGAGADASAAPGTEGAPLAALLAADVDRAASHFPPCMQQLHRALRAERHLKFHGRQQLGLFLRAAGLPLAEALAFWRAAFAPRVSPDQFTRDYAYNVRHNYGQEGRRANYPSYSCARTCALPAPGPGEHHGCPFRHARGERLAAALAPYAAPGGARLQPPQLRELVALADAAHPQLACTRLFELTRPARAPIETIAHPHRFYEASLHAARK